MTRIEKIIETLQQMIEEKPEQYLLREILKQIKQGRIYEGFTSGFATPEKFEKLFGFVREKTKEYYATTPDEDKSFYWGLAWDIEDPKEEFNEKLDEIDDFMHLDYSYSNGLGIELDADNIHLDDLR